MITLDNCAWTRITLNNCTQMRSIIDKCQESLQTTVLRQRRIQAMEMRFYRKILHISYKDHVTNKEVHAKIQHATGPHEDLLTTVKRSMQTAVVWSCFPFIRCGQTNLARHSERGKKTRQTEEEVERQHQGMDRPGFLQVPEGSGEQGKKEKTGCKIICGAPTTLTVKGLIMMIKMKQLCIHKNHSRQLQTYEKDFGQVPKITLHNCAQTQITLDNCQKSFQSTVHGQESLQPTAHPQE